MLGWRVNSKSSQAHGLQPVGLTTFITWDLININWRIQSCRKRTSTITFWRPPGLALGCFCFWCYYIYWRVSPCAASLEWTGGWIRRRHCPYIRFSNGPWWPFFWSTHRSQFTSVSGVGDGSRARTKSVFRSKVYETHFWIFRICGCCSICNLKFAIYNLQ